MLFLALSGTAGAQDNPFPSGSNFLFLPDVRTAPVPQPSATIDELHPVKLVLPGPCLPSGECPTLDRGFVWSSCDFKEPITAICIDSTMLISLFPEKRPRNQDDKKNYDGETRYLHGLKCIVIL
jgi:hypothetical protein